MDLFLAGFILGIGTVLVILVVTNSYRAYRRTQDFLLAKRQERLKAEHERRRGKAATAVVPKQPGEEPCSQDQPVPLRVVPAERPVLGTMDHRRIRPVRRR